MQRALIIIGLIVLAIALAWPLLSRLPLGKLPGDILLTKKHVTVYFPVTTCIIISLALSIIFWFFRR